jgi:hypothetical protein
VTFDVTLNRDYTFSTSHLDKSALEVTRIGVTVTRAVVLSICNKSQSKYCSTFSLYPEPSRAVEDVG